MSKRNSILVAMIALLNSASIYANNKKLDLCHIVPSAMSAAACSSFAESEWKKIAGTAKPKSGFKKVLEKEDYTLFLHRTNFDRAVAILKTGGMKTGDQVETFRDTGDGYGMNRPGKLFFFASKLKEPLNVILEAATPGGGKMNDYHWNGTRTEKKRNGYLYFIYDLAFADGARFHVSNTGELRFGSFRPEEHFLSTSNAKVFATWLEGTKKPHEPPKPATNLGEFVFYQDAPMQFMNSIWVHPARRDEFLGLLVQNGIQEINGRPIQEFVQSPAIPPGFTGIWPE